MVRRMAGDGSCHRCGLDSRKRDALRLSSLVTVEGWMAGRAIQVIVKLKLRANGRAKVCSSPHAATPFTLR